MGKTANELKSIGRIMAQLGAGRDVDANIFNMLELRGLQATDIIGNMMGAMDRVEAQYMARAMSGSEFLDKLVQGLNEGTRAIEGSMLQNTAAFAGMGYQVLGTFQGARKFMQDAWDNLGEQAMGRFYDEYGQVQYRNLDKVTRAMVNMSNVIRSLGPLFEPILATVFGAFERLSEVALRASNWFNNLSESTQFFLGRMMLVVALVGPALTLFSVLGGTLLPMLKKAFLNAVVGIGVFAAAVAPLALMFGSIFLIWNRDLGGIRSSVERAFRDIISAVQRARRMMSGCFSVMQFELNRLGNEDGWQARLTRNIVAVHTLFSAFRDYIRSGELYPRHFYRLNQMGLMPTYYNLVNLHERFRMFFAGFQEGLASFAASFVGAFNKIANIVGNFGKDLSPLAGILHALADSDPALWHEIGRALGTIIIPMLLFSFAISKLQGAYMIFSKLGLGISKIGAGLKGGALFKLLPLVLVFGLLALVLKDTENAAEIMNILGNLFELFIGVVSALVPIVLGLIENVLMPLASITFAVFIGALEFVIGLLSRFTDWAVENQGIIQALTITLIGLYTAFKVFMGIKALIALVGILAAKFKTLIVVKVALTIATWTKNMALMANPITWIILAVVALIAAIVALVVAVVRNWDTIMDVLRTAVAWINDKVIQPIVNFFRNLWEIITGIVTSIVETIRSIFGIVAEWVMSNVVDPIIGFFTRLGYAITNIFSGIRDAVSTVMGAVVSIVKAPINAIIGLINTFLRGINRIQIPNWVPGVGGRGINIPLIPKLQTGGLIKAEGIAYLHPAEVVLNSKLTKGLSDILANSDFRGAKIVKNTDEKSFVPIITTASIPAMGVVKNEPDVEPFIINPPTHDKPTPIPLVVVKPESNNIPIRGGSSSNVSSLPATSDGDVYFEKDSIQITIASAAPEEAKKFVDLIFKEIKRKKELEDMSNYRRIDRRLQMA